MAYLNKDDRTQVLLEVIEDAYNLTQPFVAVGAEPKLSEAGAHKVLLALGMVVGAAKRHPDWPETQRKRDAEYEESERRKTLVAPQISGEVPKEEEGIPF